MIAAVKAFWSASIRRQLIGGIVLVHAVLMSLFVFDLVERQRTFLHQEQVERSMSLAQGLARNSTSWVLASDIVGMQEVVSAFASYPDLRYAMIVDMNGRVLAHTDKTKVGRFASDDISARLRTAAQDGTVLVSDARVIDLAAPVRANNRTIAWARLSTGLDHAQEGLQVVTVKGVFYTLVAIAVGTLFAMLMARGLTRSLYRLLKVAEATRDGRRDLRAQVDETNETGRLSVAFNRMLDALADSEHRLQALNGVLEQRVLERTAELAAANEEVRNFAYIVSHDLRAPLVNVQGFCGELRYSMDDLRAALAEHGKDLAPAGRTRLADILDGDMPEALRFIDNAIRKMDAQINAVLKLSRLGRNESRLEHLDLDAMVRSLADTMHHEIRKDAGTIEVEPLPYIVADRTAVDQIFGNLLSNAVKYLEPGRPARLRIWADQAEAGTTIHVEDNGRGMAAEDIPRAFELFRRVGRQDTQGEGMGLAYVQTLVRRYHGRIWCDSVAGVGTTFHVFLPPLALNLTEEAVS